MSNRRTNDVQVGQRQLIEAQLQEIVEDINENRKQHTESMTKFKKELEKQASNEGNFSRKDHKVTSHDLNNCCELVNSV